MKLLLVSFSFIILFSHSLRAQNKQLDSLKIVLEHSNAYYRLSIFEKIVEYEIAIYEIDEAEKYAHLGLEESIYLNAQYGIVGSLIYLSQIEQYRGNYNEALYYDYQSLSFSEQEKDSFNIALAYYRIGTQYSNMSKLDTGFLFLTKALDIFRAIGNKKYEAQSLHAIAIIYEIWGDLVKSIKLNLQSLAIYEELRDIEGIQVSLHNIAVVYGYNRNYEKSLEYYNISLKIAEIKRDFSHMVFCLNNIGALYGIKGEYKTTEKYFYKALFLSNKIQYPLGVAMSKLNIGTTLANLNKTDKAIIFLNQADSILKKVKNSEMRSQSLLGLGNCYKTLGLNNKAFEYFNEGNHLADSLGLIKSIGDSYLYLAEIYNLVGQSSNAYKYQKLYTQLKDSIYNVEASSKIANLTSQYQIEKKEAEVSELEKDKTITLSKLQKQQAKIISLSIGLFGLILLGLLFNSRRKLKNKTEIKTLLALEREKQTMLLVESVEVERMKIAQELHDRVGTLLTSTKLSVEDVLLKRGFVGIKEELSNTSQLIDQAVKEVRIISHQMASKVLTYFGLIAAIKDLISHIPANSGISFTFIHDGFTDQLKEEIELCLYRVTQEAVNNIIKHAEANQVLIKLVKGKGNNIILSISDNGKGYNYLQTISGMGIERMKTRVSILRGVFSIISSKKGTAIQVHIPIGELIKKSNISHEKDKSIISR